MKRTILLLTALLSSSPVWSGTFSGQLNATAGFDANPAGYSGGEAQSIGSTLLQMSWTAPTGQTGSWHVDYAGGGSAFAPASDWTTHNNTISAGYERDLVDNLLVGVLGGVGGSWNRPAYDVYSYRKVSGELWAQALVGPMPLFVSAGGLVCTYPASDAFNYREFSVSAFTSLQFPTRTVVRLSAQGTGRTYTTQTLEDILAGLDNATSKQLQISTSVSQGITDESGLLLSAWAVSGSGESRWQDDYAQAMDNPLSTRGGGGRIQFSTLAPRMLTFRTYVGVQRTGSDYVTALSEYGARTDDVAEVGAILEGPVPLLSQVEKLTWSAEVNGRRQSSDDPTYTFNTASLMVGLKFAF